MSSNVTTVAEVSKFFGVSERIIQKWLELGCPVLIRGGAGRGDVTKIDSVAVSRWMIDRHVARATRDRPDAELKRAQAGLAQLDLDERLGKLVPVDEIEPVWAAAILATRAELLNLGARLKTSLDARYGVDIDQRMIDDMVHAALQKMSENPPPDDEEEAAPADETEFDPLADGDGDGDEVPETNCKGE